MKKEEMGSGDIYREKKRQNFQKKEKKNSVIYYIFPSIRKANMLFFFLRVKEKRDIPFSHREKYENMKANMFLNFSVFNSPSRNF